MTKRVHRGIEGWREIVEQFEQSGLTQMEFAKAHGLCRATLCAWIGRFKEPTGEKTAVSAVMNPPSFAFLELNPSKEGPAFPFPRSVRCEIAFSEGLRLKIESGVAWDQVQGFIQTFLEKQRRV